MNELLHFHLYAKCCSKCCKIIEQQKAEIAELKQRLATAEDELGIISGNSHDELTDLSFMSRTFSDKFDS